MEEGGQIETLGRNRCYLLYILYLSIRVVSEQASEQVGLTDPSSGASTFPGERTSGGWIPVMLRPKGGGRPIQIDWICPACNRLTGNYRACPSCGLEVKTTPHIHDPLPKSKKIKHHKKWALELFNPDDDAGVIRCDHCGQKIKNLSVPCFCNCCGQRIFDLGDYSGNANFWGHARHSSGDGTIKRQ